MLAILEPLAVFGLIMAYIWALRAICPNFWMAILGLMLLSHLLRRETPGMLGFGTRNLRSPARELAPAVAFLVLLMASCGILLHTVRPVSLEGAIAALAVYLPWGLLQQYILNGYCLNRFGSVLAPRAAALVTAALFCAAHAPNWFLMSVTFPGGYYATRVYQRCRNVYLLGLAHAIAGFLIFLLVPDSISHHLRVGPAWFTR
jgi:membrane protease YdiL (CAAX protease family)